MTRKQVINGLLCDRLMQMVSFSDLNRGYDLCRRPFRGAPVNGFSPFDDVVHRPDGLFDGGGFIWTMTVDQVNVIELQSFQRPIDAFDQSLAVKRALFIYVVMQSPIEFCGDQITAAPPA